MRPIDADEFLAQVERRKKYLILQYKKTDDKKYYYRLSELRRVEQYVSEVPRIYERIKDEQA